MREWERGESEGRVRGERGEIGERVEKEQMGKI